MPPILFVVVPGMLTLDLIRDKYRPGRYFMKTFPISFVTTVHCMNKLYHKLIYYANTLDENALT